MHSSRMPIVRRTRRRGEGGACLGGVCPGGCLPGGVCPSACWDSQPPGQTRRGRGGVSALVHAGIHTPLWTEFLTHACAFVVPIYTETETKVAVSDRCDKGYQCKVCNRKFNSLSGRYLHEKKHTGKYKSV